MITFLAVIVGLSIIIYLMVNVFYLIELADDVAGDNSKKGKEFFKTITKISIILGIGIYIEYINDSFPSIFSNIAFFIWGNILIIAPFILIDKLNKKIKKIIGKFKKN